MAVYETHIWPRIVRTWKITSILALLEAGEALKGFEAPPLLVWANWYYFRPGESVSFRHVESVCVLWSARGSGTVWSAGAEFFLRPGTVLVLPWMHDIEYLADPTSPFQLGTIHLVPRFRGTSSESVLGVGLETGDGIFGDLSRGDNPESLLRSPTVYSPSSLTARNLIHLGSYAIQHVQNGAVPFDVLSSLGGLIYLESGAISPARDSNSPPDLLAMKEFMLQNLARKINASDIARAARCSVSSAERVFSKYEGLTPRAWLSRTRLQQASFLLQSTNMNISEVAFQVGFNDPLYFSKVFRKTHGVPPSKFASHTALQD